MKKKIIIFGISDAAQVAYFYFKHDTDHEIVGFTIDKKYINSEKFCNLPIIAFEEVEKKYPPSQYDMFVAIGYSDLNALRTKKYFEAKKKGYKLANYISSKATIWPELEVGDNCFILENNTIQPFVKIGNNVTLWSGNHIGHHSIIKDNCFISSHVVISGGVTVEENCFIGVNATIRDHIVIGKNNIISAGALILKNTVPDGVYLSTSAELAKISSDRLKNKI